NIARLDDPARAAIREQAAQVLAKLDDL
ncbi:MAG: hypothetical protein RL669_1431, partial [Pseudomonadota bacterium]